MYVNFIQQFVNKIGVDSFYLAGNSLGGLIAWKYAATYPHRCRAIVLYGSFSRFSYWFPTEEALERARRLEAHQRESPGNLAHTVLRLSVEHPDEDSDALAARASRASGRPLLPAAFRKQLSRARRLFAGFLVAEVAQTLEEPTAERVEEELAAVGILPVVRDFLPPDWKDQLPRG